jgi:hypothetical protein
MADVSPYCSVGASIANTHMSALLTFPDNQRKLQTVTFIGVNFLAEQLGQLDPLCI